MPAGMAGEKQAEKVIFGGVTDPYPIYVKKTTADAVWFLFQDDNLRKQGTQRRY